MKAQFFLPNPTSPARAKLNEILAKGESQIAIACAYFSDAGLEILRPHFDRLRLPESFVVVAWDGVTKESVDALNTLNAEMPGNLYLNLGLKTPEENLVGRGLMHSKVFFARASDDAWLWTGSHNLTASAFGGVNAEAAVLLSGKVLDDPIKDAVAHLSALKSESWPYEDICAHLIEWVAEPTLVIHAERHVSDFQPFCHIHFLPPTTEYDGRLNLTRRLWLCLYSPGTLRMNHPRPHPEAAYSGHITGVNLTDSHPDYEGIPADYSADYIIQQDGDVFKLTDLVHDLDSPTQGVFHIQKTEDPAVDWLKEKPRAGIKPTSIQKSDMGLADQDLQKFFTQDSVKGGHFIRRAYKSLRQSYRMPMREFSTAYNTVAELDFRLDNANMQRVVDHIDKDDIRRRLSFPPSVDIEPKALPRNSMSQFIYVAKYKVDSRG